MKKVLFFIHDLGNGGAEKVLVNLVNNIDKTKFDVTVQVLFKNGVNEQFLNSDVKYKYCYSKTFRGNKYYFKLFSPKTLYKRFVKEKYDVIVSYLEGPTARIVSGCTDENTKLVSWIHCRYDSIAEASRSFRNSAEAKMCYNKFDNTVCVSKWAKESFAKVFDFKKLIEVLHNTIETDMILEKSNEEFDDVSFSDDCINICSVGSVKSVKGFERLASVHKKLIDDGIKNKVYILGIGEEQKNIEKYLADNKLTDSFVFLGYKTNPYKYVKACDLYVCSSYSEGFSTSVTEALIVGTPVVTTLCAGMQELLGENNEYGIVTENNEEALYEGIKKMLTTEGMLEDYASKALERGKYFSKEKTVKAVEDMFLKL